MKQINHFWAYSLKSTMQFDYTCKSLHFSWALSTCRSYWKLLLPSLVTASLFHTFVFIPCMGRQNHPASVYLVASALFGFYSYICIRPILVI